MDRHRSLRSSLASCTLLGLLLGCGNEPPPPLPTGSDLPWTASATQTTTLPEGALLVTDSSASMKGFVIPGSIALTTLHEELTGSLGAAVPGDIEYRTVAREVSRSLPTASMARYSNKGLYSGGESRFDKVLDLEDEEEGPASRRLTLIVTDGVYGGAIGQSSSQAGCAVGATVACIGQRFEALVQDGYGIWMVGASLPFEGTVYAERAMDQAMFERVQQGLAEHQAVSRFHRSASEADFHYKGPRPLLIVVLTKDTALGAGLAADVKRRLESSKIADPMGRGIELAQLAPVEAQRASIAGLAFHGTKVTPGFLMGDAAVLQGPGGARAGFGQVIQCGRQDKAMLQATVAGMRDDLELRLGPSVSDEAVVQIERLEQGFAFGVLCEKLPAAQVSDLTLELHSDHLAAALQEGWSNEWSAPDTYSRPDALFGLADIARAATKPAASGLGLDDRLYLRVATR